MLNHQNAEFNSKQFFFCNRGQDPSSKYQLKDLLTMCIWLVHAIVYVCGVWEFHAGKFYFIRYRRIAGDTCEKSDDNSFDSHVTLPCPNTSMFT